jgi:hypothetical protein
MTAASLVALFLVGTDPTPDPVSLVAKLGADSFAEREAASQALEAMGREALRALIGATHSKDAEVRARAEALYDRIEVTSLLEPTQIDLDLKDRPLFEALEAFNRQTECRSPLVPGEREPSWSRRRVSLQTAGPVTFWDAVDRLCAAGHLEFDHSGPAGARMNPSGLDPIMCLFFEEAGSAKGAGLSFDTGPFRVNLANLRFSKMVRLAPGQRVPRSPFQRGEAFRIPPDPAPPSLALTAVFELMGEPRLMISPTGELRLLEAVDDKGQSLLATSPDQRAAKDPPSFGSHPSNFHSFSVSLLRPSDPGRTIKRLRGLIPVGVAACKSNPLVIPLPGSFGKLFRGDGATIVPRAFQGEADQQRALDLTIQLDSMSWEIPFPLPRRRRANFDPFAGRPFDVPENQFEVVDAEGRKFQINITVKKIDLEGFHLSISLRNELDDNAGPQPAPKLGEPAELRFYGLAQTATDVRFEFHDVPLP